MQCHRIEELLELLEPEWQKDQQLNLLQFVVKLAQEAGYQGPLEELTDDVLIYHLKMRNSAKDEMIPGLKKDQEDDFKTALLRARGILK
ncbi:YihD family protein [Vibrio aestuarianus]|uniref:YihD family protein n=1 Tax=Vibrio aestuarianus TaxID=28171 RepID=A0AAX3U252_9VIBR|nr:YihD family protein [Vibrio aestuarianus]NGZ14287.1 YihD family protein [Vibrio aestuarianus]NKZ50435.1 YihD family protein [Vibrio aestuarianus]WGK81501.1 YihD family protein [Vibrio aestuarianus]